MFAVSTVGVALLFTLLTASINTTTAERVVWSMDETELGVVKTGLVRGVPLGITIDFTLQAEEKVSSGVVLLRGTDWFVLDDGTSLSAMRVDLSGTPEEQIFLLRVPSPVRATNEELSLYIDNLKQSVTLTFSDGQEISADSFGLFSLVEFQRPDSSPDAVKAISALTERVENDRSRLRATLWWVSGGLWVTAILTFPALPAGDSNRAVGRSEGILRPE